MEDDVAKVTGDGGFLTFKNSGKTRVYGTTNSPGYYTCREVNVLNDEITESGIQITVENIYGTKTYGVTPSYKSKLAGMQTEVPEYSFNVPYEETVFNFGVHGLNESARVDPKHATLRHMSTYTTDNSGVIIANLEEITVSALNNTVFIDGEFEIFAKCAPTSTLTGTGKFRAGSVPGDMTFTVKVTAENRTVKEYPVVIHVVYPSGNGWRLSADTLYADNRDRSKHIPRYDQSPRYRYRDYIKHVSFDDNLSVIAPLMLYGCYNITELQLPTSIKVIGDNAFTGCDNLGKIILESQIPPKVNQCTFLGSKGLHMENKTALYVHGEARSAYSNSNCWRDFKYTETIENNDASLTSLNVRYHSLTPAFDKDIFEYSVIVPRELYSIIIDAESADPDAQVGGQGIFKSVVFEDTVFTVGVTAANHADRNEYKINIRRIGSYATLKSIKVNDLQLYPAFNKDTLDYVCIVPDSVEYFRLSVEPAHKYTKLSYNPSYKMDYGKTTFNIRTVSENGSHSLTYKVTAVKPFYNRQSEEPATGTVNVPAADVQAFIRDKVVHIDSQVSERIDVYSVTGKLLRRFEKPAGKATFASAGSSTGRVLIVRGEFGPD